MKFTTMNEQQVKELGLARGRGKYPFATMKVNEALEFEDKSEYLNAVKNAGAYNHTHKDVGTKLVCRWNKTVARGFIVCAVRA